MGQDRNRKWRKTKTGTRTESWVRDPGLHHETGIRTELWSDTGAGNRSCIDIETGNGEKLRQGLRPNYGLRQNLWWI